MSWKRMTWSTVVLVCLLVTGASAQDESLVILPGGDLFKSPAALGSEYDIGECMLPGEFFEVGDPELTGCVVPTVPKDPEDPGGPLSFLLRLQGVPLQTYLDFEIGTIDTVVLRTEPLDFGADPQEDVTVSTPVEVVALKLISTDPIEITCDQGVTRWIAEVEVDEETGPSLGEMNVTLQHPALNGGTASSILDICPRVRFTRIDPGTSGSFEVFPCDLLCGPQLEGETTWSVRSPDPDNALGIEGLTSDNFFFTELLTPAESAAVEAAIAPLAKMNGCNPDCPCVFKYPHLSANHLHQACLPCPCDADMQDPIVMPPPDLTVECTEPGGTSRFATCIDPDPGAGTLCLIDWLDSVTCEDRPDPAKISSCGALGPPTFFDADCSDDGKETPVSFQAVDECCNDDTDTASVFVRDTTAPVVMSGGDDLHCLWPANHEYVCFDRSQFAPNVDEACHDYSWKFVGCASNQPDIGPGSGNTMNDCQVTCNGEAICVRAERQNNDPDGRRYEVEILATDECNNAGTAEIIGFIHVPQNSLPGCIAPPDIHAQCGAAPTSGDATLAVNFTDTSTTNGPVINSWLWDFDDGGTSTVQNPSHDYTVPGMYTPTLMVATNPPGGCNPSAGLTGFATCPDIDVTLPPPTCQAAPTSGIAPLAVAFTGQSSIPNVTWQWDFGDGNSSMAQNPSHTYANPGMFNPTATISINGKTASTACPPIDVNSPPGPIQCDLPEVTFPSGGGNMLTDVQIVVTDSNGNPATITIVSIFQDEPVTGQGSGQTCPDAEIATTTTLDDTARVRNERQGKGGDGRVYHIEFTAVGSNGSMCSGGSGEITVCVPKGNNPCVDSSANGGTLFPSIPNSC